MIKQRYPADQIQAMRDCLKYDGWLQSPHLPLNWLYKAEKNGKSQFLDEQGNLYKSMLQVMRDGKNEEYRLCFDRCLS